MRGRVFVIWCCVLGMLIFVSGQFKRPDNPLQNPRPVVVVPNPKPGTVAVTAVPNQQLVNANTAAPLSSSLPAVRATPLPDLTEVAARQRYYDGLLQRDALSLWGEWTQLLDNTSSGGLLAWMLVGDALPYRLRLTGNDEAYAQIQALLQQNSISPKAWQYALEILGRTATPQALQILLETALANTAATDRMPVLRAIELAADTRWAQQFHPELSPLLESAWGPAQASHDKPLLGTLAVALAKTGAPSGVELLLDTVRVGGNTVAELQANTANDQLPQVVAAWVSLRKIHNPAAIPILQRTLTSMTPEAPVYEVSGEALARIGGLEGAQALWAWAQTAPASTSSLAQQWFMQIPDRPAHQWLTQQLTTPPAGMNSEVYQAIMRTWQSP